MESLREHTRPVESLDAYVTSGSSATLYTADTMGIIKVWEITKEEGVPSRLQTKLVGELKHHRTRVNDMVHGSGHLWTGALVLPHLHPLSGFTS